MSWDSAASSSAFCILQQTFFHFSFVTGRTLGSSLPPNPSIRSKPPAFRQQVKSTTIESCSINFQYCAQIIPKNMCTAQHKIPGCSRKHKPLTHHLDADGSCVFGIHQPTVCSSLELQSTGPATTDHSSVTECGVARGAPYESVNGIARQVN